MNLCFMDQPTLFACGPYEQRMTKKPPLCQFPQRMSPRQCHSPAGPQISQNAPGGQRQLSSRTGELARMTLTTGRQPAPVRSPQELQAVGPAGVKPPGSGFGTSSKRPVHTREASKGDISPATRRNSFYM